MNKLKLGDNEYNCKWLRSVSEEQAVRTLPMKEVGQVRNAWKQANGKSVRNHNAEKEATKRKRKPKNEE